MYKVNSTASAAVSSKNLNYYINWTWYELKTLKYVRSFIWAIKTRKNMTVLQVFCCRDTVLIWSSIFHCKTEKDTALYCSI